MSTEPSNDLEIVICTHNRCSLLQRVVRSILSADLPDDGRVGIFVVANGCTDGTESVLNQWQGDPDFFQPLTFRWKTVEELGKSVALNQSLGEITSPVVAFVDDDHRVHHQYIQAVFAAIRKYPEENLFCGRILPDWDAREPRWVHDTGVYRVYPLPVPRYDLGTETQLLDDRASIPGGGNLFLRTALIPKVGDFKTDLGPVGHNLGGAEDIDWVQRAVSLGESIRYVPGATQHHYVDAQRLTLRYLMKKAYERTSSIIRVRSGEPDAPKIPLFTLRKSFSYAINALLSVTASRRRYYLVRTAAAIGEIDGFRRRRATQQNFNS